MGSTLKRKSQEKRTTNRRHFNVGEMISLFSAKERGPGEGEKHLLWKKGVELLHQGFGQTIKGVVFAGEQRLHPQ